jgi:hypothetical protein
MTDLSLILNLASDKIIYFHGIKFLYYNKLYMFIE